MKFVIKKINFLSSHIYSNFLIKLRNSYTHLRLQISFLMLKRTALVLKLRDGILQLPFTLVRTRKWDNIGANQGKSQNLSKFMNRSSIQIMI